MSRCTCCNRVLTRSSGNRTLPDGTKVEETFCTVCRNEVNLSLHSSYGEKSKQFDGILDMQIRYGSVTPQRNPKY